MSTYDRYEPKAGDLVTTVSLQKGVVTDVRREVLTVQRLDGSEYYAHADAVIRVQRYGNADFAVSRMRSGARQLLPMSTSFGEQEFRRYVHNRRPEWVQQQHGVISNRHPYRYKAGRIDTSHAGQSSGVASVGRSEE